MTLAPRALVRTLFSFEGRISRHAYWLMICVMQVINYGVVLSINGWTGDFSGSTRYRALVNLVLIWPRAALTVKRGHDRGRSIGYSLVLFLTSFAGLALAAVGHDRQDFGLVFDGVVVWTAAGCYQGVEYAFLSGDPGPNRYGPGPGDFYAAKPAPPREVSLPGEGPRA